MEERRLSSVPPNRGKTVSPRRRVGAFLVHPYLIAGSRVLLGLIFIRASVGKIGHPAAFADVIEDYHLLPLSLVNLFAVVLPWIELISGIGLVVGVLTRGNALIINSLLVVFMIALGINVLRGVDIDCGCFDVGDGESIQEALMRDVLFLLLGFHVLWFDQGALTLDALRARREKRR